MICYDVDAALGEVPVNTVPLIDDGDFKSTEESVAYNASGMSLKWHFKTPNGAWTVTDVTPTSGGTYDWAHQGHGMYSIEIPASGGASINNDTEGFGYFTGKITGVLPFRGPTLCFRAAGLNDALIESAYSTTRGLAGTALPNAVAGASGGVLIAGSNAATTLASLTISGLFHVQDGARFTAATTDRHGFEIAGNGDGAGIYLASGEGGSFAAFEVFSLNGNAVAFGGGTGSLVLEGLNLSDLLEDDGGVARFTANALEEAPSGGGGSSDWTADERTVIRAVLGIPGSGTTPADPTTGILDTIRDNAVGIKAKTDNLPSDPADASDIASSLSSISGKIDTVDAVVDAIKLTTDKLDDTLEDDGGTYRFTENALEEAPSGGGGGGDATEAKQDQIIALIGTPANTSVSGDIADMEGKVDDLEGRLTATRAGYLDNLSVGPVAQEATLTAMKGATFDSSTDSLEAMRNRGDSAWITATGFSTLNAAGVRAAVGLASANLDSQLADLPTNAELSAALGTADDAVLAAVGVVDGVVDAIKVVTDQFVFGVTGVLNANITHVNEVEVGGNGQSGSEWGPV